MRLPTDPCGTVDLRDEVAEDEPPPIETYVHVQVRQCQDDDDPGEIAEGWFSVDDGVVTVTNATGKFVGSHALLKGEDARSWLSSYCVRKSRRARALIADWIIRCVAGRDYPCPF